MIDYLLAADWLSLRWLVRLLALSVLLTVGGLWLFHGNAITRRAFILFSGGGLFALSLVALAGGEGVWIIPTLAPSGFDLGPALHDKLPNVFAWLWFGVAGLLLLRLAAKVISARYQLNHLPRIDDPRINALVAKLQLGVGGHRVLKVRRGDDPCASSLGSAVIVLPADYAHWNEETLRAVLAHELVHVHRRDDLALLAVRILALWYWWMPWLRLLEERFEQSMEESCDDRAAEVFGTPVGYLSGVVTVAGNGRFRATLPQHSHHGLLRRVSRFSHPRDHELNTSGLYWIVTAATLALAVGTSFEFRPESLYSLNRLSPVAPRAPSVSAQQSSYPVVRASQSLQWKIPLAAGRGSEPRFGIAGDYRPVGANRSASSTGIGWNGEVVEAAARTSTNDKGRLSTTLIVADAPNPIYPGSALRQGTEGEVVVDYFVTADGRTARAKIVFAQPERTFDRSVLRAVRQTRYSVQEPPLSSATDPPAAGVLVRRHFRFRIRTSI